MRRLYVVSSPFGKSAYQSWPSAWGLSELIGGETLVLTAVALLLLATARTLVNRFGTSIAMAGIAVLFKSVNTAPFFCHLMGIILLGVAFDLAATLLWRDDRRAYIRAAATGAVGAYLSCFFFASSMALSSMGTIMSVPSTEKRFCPR